MHFDRVSVVVESLHQNKELRIPHPELNFFELDSIYQLTQEYSQDHQVGKFFLLILLGLGSWFPQLFQSRPTELQCRLDKRSSPTWCKSLQKQQLQLVKKVNTDLPI